MLLIENFSGSWERGNRKQLALFFLKTLVFILDERVPSPALAGSSLGRCWVQGLLVGGGGDGGEDVRGRLPCSGSGAVLANGPGTRRLVETAKLMGASPRRACSSASRDTVLSLWPPRGLGSGSGTPVALRASYREACSLFSPQPKLRFVEAS